MKTRLIAFFLVILACCVGFGIYYVIEAKRIASPPQTIVPHHEGKPAPPEDTEGATSVKIYRVGVENDKEVLRAVDVAVKPGKSPMKAALLSLIKDSGKKNLANPIPSGTRLLGLNFKNGLATIDFSHEFSDNFHGGSDAEALLVRSILRTLSQFSQVKHVRLLVEGKPLDTLGHLDLSEALDVKMSGSEQVEGN